MVTNEIIKLSIVVCTYNRDKLLFNCLNSLINQEAEPSNFEIIVIDNNSSDETERIIKKINEKYVELRYYKETNQGLAYARNRGWKEAKGEYIAFVDDDCKIPSNWISIALDVIYKIAPPIVGGSYFAYYDSAKPHWYKDKYGSLDFGQEARSLLLDEFPSGGNMIIRRALLEILGGFNINLGMKGKKIGYGEETDLIIRARSALPKMIIYFDPRLFVYHLVPAKKMTLRWIIKSNFSSGRYGYLVIKSGGKNSFNDNRSKPLYQTLFISFVDLIKFIFARDKIKYPYWENYFSEDVSRYFRGLGNLYELILIKVLHTN